MTPPPSQPPRPAAEAPHGLLKQVNAAKFCNVNVRTIYRWERQGLIHGRRMRPGGAKFYDVRELRAAVTGYPPDSSGQCRTVPDISMRLVV